MQKYQFWRLLAVSFFAPPYHVVECWLTQLARHAQSVQSRTIMKKQPSAGAAAEANFSNVNWAFLSRHTENTADRWIKATAKLFLNLNGEENGERDFAKLRFLIYLYTELYI